MVGRSVDPQYRNLSDEALADLLAGGDEKARDEATRRYLPVAIKVAKRLCSKLFHRSAPCGGWNCDQHFSSALNQVLLRIAGRPVAKGHPPHKSLLVTWRAEATGASFSRFVDQCWRQWEIDVLRSANVDRGLPARLRCPNDVKAALGDLYLRLVTSHGLFCAAAGRLGLTDPSSADVWLTALWLDACQAGLNDLIDHHRVARKMLPGTEMTDDILADVATCAEIVDRALAAVFPDFHAKYFDRPRQHTRQWDHILPVASGTPEDAGTDGAAPADDGEARDATTVRQYRMCDPRAS
jgi:hypothetical protein